jgi:hypothetical protein
MDNYRKEKTAGAGRLPKHCAVALSLFRNPLQVALEVFPSTSVLVNVNGNAVIIIMAVSCLVRFHQFRSRFHFSMVQILSCSFSADS